MHKILYITAMNGRHDTVLKCIESMPKVERLFVYTDQKDGQFIEDKCSYSFEYRNNPISYKWQHALDMAKGIDFDSVVILGSDDYVDENFIRFIEENAPKYDFIGFKDIYFEQDDKTFYWGGYTNSRMGEPIGAGRTISRRLLDEMDWDLWDRPANSGLDFMAWNNIKMYDFTKLITTLKENGLYMADVKDGKGITPLNTIADLVLIKN